MKKKTDVEKSTFRLGSYGSKPDRARPITDENLVDVIREISEDYSGDFEYGIAINHLMRKKHATA